MSLKTMTAIKKQLIMCFSVASIWARRVQLSVKSNLRMCNSLVFVGGIRQCKLNGLK